MHQPKLVSFFKTFPSSTSFDLSFREKKNFVRNRKIGYGDFYLKKVQKLELRREFER